MNDTVDTKLEAIDIIKILDLIPHRYPMLLVDRLIDIVPNESAIGIKNVTMNEPMFQGHFPGKPVFPGVMIVEAMAQSAGALVMYSLGDKNAGNIVYFMSIESAKFRKPVVPGDRLEMHISKERQRGAVWRFRGEAMVDGQLVAEATFTAMISAG